MCGLARYNEYEETGLLTLSQNACLTNILEHRLSFVAADDMLESSVGLGTYATDDVPRDLFGASRNRCQPHRYP